MLHAGVLVNFDTIVFQIRDDMRGPLRIHINPDGKLCCSHGQAGAGLIAEIADVRNQAV